jgi:hypothetical protein
MQGKKINEKQGDSTLIKCNNVKKLSLSEQLVTILKF